MKSPCLLNYCPTLSVPTHYRSIGTAFALGHNTYVTAAHVMLCRCLAVNTDRLPCADRTVPYLKSRRFRKFPQYQDFVVFSLRQRPGAGGSCSQQEPRVDDPVFAVGNALGEGIVIRDGLYTSATAEEQDRSLEVDPIFRRSVTRQQRRTAPRRPGAGDRHRKRKVAQRETELLIAHLRRCWTAPRAQGAL